MGKLSAGALLRVSKSLPAGQATESEAPPFGYKNIPDSSNSEERNYIYTEYPYQDESYPSLSGGIASCSTKDNKVFTFEGFVLYYGNLSDMVYGSAGPFLLQKPKVTEASHY
jgi:hypothetical protein